MSGVTFTSYASVGIWKSKTAVGQLFAEVVAQNERYSSFSVLENLGKSTGRPLT